MTQWDAAGFIRVNALRLVKKTSNTTKVLLNKSLISDNKGVNS